MDEIERYACDCGHDACYRQCWESDHPCCGSCTNECMVPIIHVCPHGSDPERCIFCTPDVRPES